MKLDIAILLKKVLDILYLNVAEIRIIYNHAYADREYAIELKKVGETCYFEDEESILLHIEEVLDKK
jgi:hypothetical protein